MSADEPQQAHPDSGTDTPPSPAAGNHGPSAGEQLRMARQRVGLSLADIEAKTLIPQNKLEALEQGEFEKVGGAAYVTGYTRAYGRLLNIDPRPFIEAFEAELGEEQAPVVEPGAFGDSVEAPRPVNQWLLWGSVAVFAAIVSLVMVFTLGDSETDEALESAPQQAPSPRLQLPEELAPRDGQSGEAVVGMSEAEPTTPSGEQALTPAPTEGELADWRRENETADSAEALAEPAPEPEPPSPNLAAQETTLPVTPEEDLLLVSFTGECWVEVSDRDGEMLVADLMQSGDNLQLFGEAPFDIMLGNARAAKIVLNGRNVNFEPRPGRRTLKLQVGQRSDGF